MTPYESLGEVVPGILLGKFPHTRNLYARVYSKETRSYTNRSTGLADEQEARQWVMGHLGELFQIEAVQRSGGSSSLRRLLTEHMEYQRKRCKAGEIAESTLTKYEDQYKQWVKWFSNNGFKKLADLKRTSIQDYALRRTNDDGIKLTTANGEVTFIRMWWSWLQETEVVQRTLLVRKLKASVETRTQHEPFAAGDLSKIYKETDKWVVERKKGVKPGNNLPIRSVTTYNKELFRILLHLLDESGARQHELFALRWKQVEVGETQTDRRRVINTLRVPQRSKRGYRIHIFRGESLLALRALHKQRLPDPSPDDLLFRNQMTHSLVDRSTFSRYWGMVQEKTGTDYDFHTFRSHRITELIMSGVEPELVARNLGLSINQILKSYLRFSAAGSWQQLVQQDKRPDQELRSLIAQ